jgi:glycosyltransferase involved in cell wall biosynthesis
VPDRDVKVSVLMLTFNHEEYIQEAIESVLSQRTDFGWELVIAEDCSTDRTRDVIRTYWQKYRDRIRVLLNRTNIGAFRTVARGYRNCRGRYVAPIDGDDYWISPHKLQRQADFLDAHPDYALCFHSVKMAWDDADHEPTVFRPRPLKETYAVGDLLQYNFIAACSPMYRHGLFDDFPSWHFVLPVGDWSTHILYALQGRIGYLDEPMGVYRQHRGSLYSQTGPVERLRIAIEMLRRFRCALPAEYGRIIDRSLCRHHQRLVRQCRDEGNVSEARRATRRCLAEIPFGPRAPFGDMIKLALRAWSPNLGAARKDVVAARNT